MWNCRVCSSSPFASLFGFGSSSDDDKKKKKRGGSTGTDASYSTSEGESVYTDRYTSQETFEPRSPEEIATLCRAWEYYVHPRAKEFWQTSEARMEILKKIAAGVHRDYDPVLGDDRQCVIWYGDLSEDDHLPVIRMVKPGESQESQTYVNRTLVFLYADEESFNELQEKPKKAFTMACGNPMCVNLTHIALDE
uniref:Uncharacterized protein n=1 Tax=Neospora caninum (strain Liverpool) TaxID=572307 RepID=A0A0F7U7Z8_NEOCL|nr:TPA: hypothetical protein BN1204_004140 [Neospora caninum Liverpool]